ncbi:alpha/beta fold hydrolase [bacterium AH-315-E10]|nr:alpha/beta fold hydrolase [bacterium AH-315-E10]
MTLFYRELGEAGADLIILHGLMGSSRNWLTIAGSLSETYHVYVLDLRNHGQSDHCDEMSLEDMRDDVIQFIETHHIANPILIGHSMGGKVAMLTAMTLGEAIRGLVVVDIAPRDYGMGLHKDILEQMDAIDFNEMHSRADVEAHLKAVIYSDEIRGFVLTNLIRQAGQLSWRLNILAILNYYETLRGFPVSQSTPFIGKTLFIKGEQSDYLQVSDNDILTSLFPCHELVEVCGTGHWLHAEKPDDTLKVLWTFLTYCCKVS